MKEGIPESIAGDIKGDEVELVGPVSEQKQLLYVGRRTISKYGCSGCHDIPGYEDVKPIGTGLADWGRKAADKLAFEQIAEYMLKTHGLGGKIHHDEVAVEGSEPPDEDASEHGFDYLNMPPNQGYFLEKLMHHEREGFIWNKLRARAATTIRRTRTRATTSGCGCPSSISPTIRSAR